MYRSIVTVLGILVVLCGIAGSTVAAPMAIHDCASFRAWFRHQPGFQLTLEGGRNYDDGAPAPRKGSDSLALDASDISYYRGFVGGGGCVGAFYDAHHRLAAFIDYYDTAQDFGETVVATAPVGIKRGTVSTPTRNGVGLGMTRRQVEAIEGPGRVHRRGNDLTLSYAWTKPMQKPRRPGEPAPTFTASPELFAMHFMVRGDRVIAIDYFFGF